MVFVEQDDIVSGGNFHGAPVAIAADLIAIAVTQFATISERRSERLVNPVLSGLPAFLTAHGGLESGLMLAQVTAAAVTSELKSLAHPASVDSIPTSANKEDHVSMSMGAALKAADAVALATQVVAVELLTAARAIDSAGAAHDVDAARAVARGSARASCRTRRETIRRRATSKRLPNASPPATSITRAALSVN